MNKPYLRPTAAVLAAALSGTALAQSSSEPIVPTSRQEPVVLAPFTVNSARDYGYRATNAMTATRTGVPIANTPLNIAVLTDEFIGDIDASFLNEALNYVSSVSTSALGNNGRIGGSGDGTRIRGFQASFNLRNGFRRDRGVSIRNIDRVEIVKGPVSQLFGQSTPGGLINYITKQPTFQNRASLQGTAGSDSLIGFEADVERAFSVGSDQENLAVRVMASKDERDLERDYEFTSDEYAIGQIAWNPVPSVRLLVEQEYLDRESNLGQGLPRSNAQWRADWARAVAEGRTADATAWYSSITNWANDITARTGKRPELLNTFDAGAYPAGALRTYNLSGPDTAFNSKSNSTSVEGSWTPSESFSVRYGFNYYRVHFFEKFNFNDTPNADNTFIMSNLSSRNNDKYTQTHQIDAQYTLDTSWGKHTFVFGAESLNDDETDRRLQYDPVAGFTAQGITRATPAASQPDRGPVLNAITSYDASTQPAVRLDRMVVTTDRLASKVFRSLEREGYYASYRLALLDDRLNVMAGVRREQADTSTFAPVNGARVTSTAKANTPTFGVNYRLVEGVTGFVGYSESFVPTTGRTASGAQARAEEISPLPAEIGEGVEVGLKLDLERQQLTGTVSFYEITRSNIASIDSARTLADPRNQDPTRPDGIKFPYDVTFFSARGEAVSRGIDFDLVWSPKRNFQLLASANHTLDAEFRDVSPIQGTGRLADGTVVRFKDVDINGTRLPRTPDWSSSLWGKYTFVSGPVSGLSVGLGARYSGEYVVFGNVDPGSGNDNPQGSYDLRGNRSDSYVVYDSSIGYTTKFGDVPVSFLLSVKNLTDKTYIAGTYTYGYGRTFALTTRFQF